MMLIDKVRPPDFHLMSTVHTMLSACGVPSEIVIVTKDHARVTCKICLLMIGAANACIRRIQEGTQEGTVVTHTDEGTAAAGTQVVYVVIWQDSHADVEPFVFTSKVTAIEWARSKARAHDNHGDLDEELTASMREAGWLYYGAYSCEGDHVRVVPCEVDAT